MPLLVEAGYRVLVPDMRGYGDSEKPAGIKGMTVARSRGVSSADSYNRFGSAVRLRSPLMTWVHRRAALASEYPEKSAASLHRGSCHVANRIGENQSCTRLRRWLREVCGGGVLPLAPGVPEILMVGKRENFSTGSTKDLTSRIMMTSLRKP